MRKNSNAKGNKKNLKEIIGLILVLGIIVLLVYICVVQRAQNSAESQEPSLSASAVNGNDTDMEAQKADNVAENELGSEGFPSETDAAGLSVTENTSSEQDDNMSSGMEERYKAILLGDGDFVNIDRSDQDIRLSLESIKEVVSDEDWVTAKVTKFTIIDLDGNGENEIVLWIQANERSDYGFESLYFQDQEVYGFTLPYRGFMHLKTDGTFYSSGGMDNRKISKLQFSERGYTIEDVSDGESQEEKADVEWYDLTSDNVELREELQPTVQTERNAEADSRMAADEFTVQEPEATSQDTKLVDMGIQNNEHNIYMGNCGDDEVRMVITRTEDDLSAAYITRDGAENFFQGELEEASAEFTLSNDVGDSLNMDVHTDDNGIISISGIGEISGNNVVFTLNQDAFFPIGEDITNYYSSLGYEAEEAERFAAMIKDSVEDKAVFAKLVTYPISICDGNHNTVIENETAMMEAYDELFEQDFKEQVGNMFTKYLFANYQGICVENGILWFHKEPSGDYKITTISLP